MPSPNTGSENIDSLANLLNRRDVLTKMESLRDEFLVQAKIGCLLLVKTQQLTFLSNSYGYAPADSFIFMAAKRLSTLLCDCAVIGRTSPDEFIVIPNEHANTENEAHSLGAAISSRMQAALGGIYRIENRAAQDNKSEPESDILILEGDFQIGMAFFGTHKEPLHHIVQRALMAIESATDDCPNQVPVTTFSDFQSSGQLKSLILAKDICSKQFKAQLEQHYQLQVDSQGIITGAECLVRWKHPKFGLLHPLDFVGLSEKSSAIMLLGYRMIELACRTLTRWSLSPFTSSLTLSVNVCPKQFYDPNFVDNITAILESYLFEHSLLRFEITEGMVIKDISTVARIIEALNGLGITVSIDDFGTGYSSLSYIQKLPVVEIKIDKSFVSDITTERRSRSIVKNIIGLAKELKLAVVSEGVECYSQIEQIAAFGDSSYQGYFINMPMTLDETENLIRVHHGGPVSQWTKKFPFSNRWSLTKACRP